MIAGDEERTLSVSGAVPPGVTLPAFRDGVGDGRTPGVGTAHGVLA
jgi:hypothetical protein